MIPPTAHETYSLQASRVLRALNTGPHIQAKGDPMSSELNSSDTNIPVRVTVSLGLR